MNSKPPAPARPKHTLVVGPSGSGKTTVAELLKYSGFDCIDADHDQDIAYWEQKKTKERFPAWHDKADGEHDWMWDVEQLERVLEKSPDGLIVCGTANNRVFAYPLFDNLIFLLPTKTDIAKRLAERTTNDFGKDTGGRDWALGNYDEIEGESRRYKSVVIDNSSQSPFETASQIIDTQIIPPSIDDWLKEATNKLSAVGITSAQLDAELLLAHALSKLRTWIIAHNDEKIVDAPALVQASMSLKKRLRRIPLAYILNRKDFYGREFAVTSDVLVPRPETEDLIELAKSYCSPSTSVIDIGTGSGCIGLTLALEYGVKLYASDVSERALALAKSNAEQFDVDVTFATSDLLDGWPGQQFDMIVANLPYVDKTWERSPETAFEPEVALFADHGGLDLIKKLIAQAPSHLSDEGILLLEADPVQHDAIVNAGAGHGLRHVETKNYIVVLQKM